MPCHVSSPLHVERSVRISRTALPHLLHVEAYWTYPAGATLSFRPRRSKMQGPSHVVDHDRLCPTLSTVRRRGDFFVSGTTELSAPLLEVDGVGPITPPLLPIQAEQLV